jgi:hypothetical protein
MSFIKSIVKRVKSRRLRKSDIKFADRIHLKHRSVWAGCPVEEMLKDLTGYARKKGWRIFEKPEVGVPGFSRPSTALRRTILLGHGFWDYSASRRLSIFEHEVNHVRYYETVNFAWFLARYVTSARYRWAVEIAAKASQLRMSIAAAGTVGPGGIGSEARNFVRFYRLKSVKGVTSATFDFLMRHTCEVAIGGRTV